MNTSRPIPPMSDLALLVQEVAKQISPRLQQRPTLVTTVVGRYVDWAQRVRGLPLNVRLLFNPEVIDLYVRDAVAAKRLAKASVASYASILMLASRTYFPADSGETRTLGRRELLAPYTSGEQQYIRIWASRQTSELRRYRAETLAALGLGCGLRAGELLNVRGGDIATGALTVAVRSGTNPRVVPVLPVWVPVLQHAADTLSDGLYLFSRTDRPYGANAINQFVSAVGSDVPISTYRMRTTYIVGRLAAGVDIRAILQAAGLERLEKLNDYLAHLPALDPQVANAQLRSEARR